MQYLVPCYQFTKPVFWGALAGCTPIERWSKLNIKVMAVAFAAFTFDAYPLSLEKRGLYAAAYMTMLALCKCDKIKSPLAKKFADRQDVCLIAFSVLSSLYQLYSGRKIQPLVQLLSTFINAR